MCRIFLAWALFIVLPARQKWRNLAFNIKWRQPNPPVLSGTKIQTLITKQQGEKRLEVSRYFFMTTKSFVFYSGLFCIASETAVSTGFSLSHFCLRWSQLCSQPTHCIPNAQSVCDTAAGSKEGGLWSSIYKQWLPNSSETSPNFANFSAGIQRE